MTNPEQSGDQEKLNSALALWLTPLLSNPEAFSCNIVQGTHILMVEISVSDEDHAYLSAEDSQVFQSLQHLLSVTRFERKVSLELVESSKS